jgi:cation:H+ antiporter
MIATIILLLIGLVILAKGSDFFIDSSTYFARRFGVSEFIVGLTLVSVGTSLPEFGASVYAAYYGNGAIAVGNIVGSNIANIALVLGITIIISDIETYREMLKRDGYIMLAVSLLFVGLAIGGVSRLDGLILITGFVLYMRLLYTVQKLVEKDVSVSVDKPPDGPKLFLEIVKLLGGSAGVFLGARLLVESAIDIATAIGVSQSVIGVTLVAFGTSAPELAVCIAAIKKKYESIAIGNVIGSNIFNILWVGGVASLVSPLKVDATILRFSMPVMIFVAILLLIFMRTNWKLERWEGVVLVALYGSFIFFNF